jgi:hypothetical protein
VLPIVSYWTVRQVAYDICHIGDEGNHISYRYHITNSRLNTVVQASVKCQEGHLDRPYLGDVAKSHEEEKLLKVRLVAVTPKYNLTLR